MFNKYLPVVVFNFASAFCSLTTAQAQNAALSARIAKLAPQEPAAVVACRCDLHQHPELGNRETRTAGIVAAELRC